MRANVIGVFDIVSPTYLKNKITGLTLLIGSRKTPTPTKPKNYLLLKHKSGKVTYISSLYEHPPKEPKNPFKIYSMDWEGVRYLVTFDEGSGEVKITPYPNSANPINNAELGVKFTPLFTPKNPKK
jgi:hypothetical protein